MIYDSYRGYIFECYLNLILFWKHNFIGSASTITDK